MTLRFEQNRAVMNVIHSMKVSSSNMCARKECTFSREVGGVDDLMTAVATMNGKISTAHIRYQQSKEDTKTTIQYNTATHKMCHEHVTL